MRSKKTTQIKKYINRTNILLGIIVTLSLSLSYLFTYAQAKYIPVILFYILFTLLTTPIMLVLYIMKYYPPEFFLSNTFYRTIFIVFSILFYILLFFLFRFIKRLILGRAYLKLAIIGISILLPFFTYWLIVRAIPTQFGWKTYVNHTNIKYGFAYPKEWVLTKCGNGSVVLSKKPIKECLYPLDASEDYIDNLYFQVFDPTGPRLDMPSKDATVSAHIKNMETVFWSAQELYDRRMRGDYVPLYVDPKKVKEETYTIASQTFRVARYKGDFPQLGVNKFEYQTNKQFQQVLDSFRF